MASRLVPYYVQVTDYDQAGEDALAITLAGKSAYSVFIFNVTAGKTRVWNGTAFINTWLANPDGSTFTGGTPAIPQSVDFICAVTIWTNKNSALQEFLNTNQRRITVDMTNATQFRILSNVTTQGVSGSVTGIQFSDDGGTTWKGLDNGNTNSNSTLTLSDLGTGSKVTSWTNLAAGAKGDRLLRVAGSGGDGAADPAFSKISLQLK